MKSRTASSNVYGRPASVSSSARIVLASRSESTSTPSLSKITSPLTPETLSGHRANAVTAGVARAGWGQFSWMEKSVKLKRCFVFPVETTSTP